MDWGMKTGLGSLDVLAEPVTQISSRGWMDGAHWYRKDVWFTVHYCVVSCATDYFVLR